MDKGNGIKAAVATAFGTVSAFLGWFGWLVVIFVGCMAADWVTGSLAAAKSGEWNSSRAREGCWHKAGAIIAVGVSALADVLIGLILNNIAGIVLPFDYTVLICPIVLIWYIVSELGSIIENAGKMGAPIPSFLQKAINALHSAADTAGEKLTAGKDEKDG